MTCFHVPHLRRHQYHSVIVGLKLPPEKFFLQPGAVVVDPSGTMTTRGIGSNKVIIRRIVHVTVTQFCLSKSPFVVPRILLRWLPIFRISPWYHRYYPLLLVQETKRLSGLVCILVSNCIQVLDQGYRVTHTIRGIGIFTYIFATRKQANVAKYTIYGMDGLWSVTAFGQWVRDRPRWYWYCWRLEILADQLRVHWKSWGKNNVIFIDFSYINQVRQSSEPGNHFIVGCH